MVEAVIVMASSRLAEPTAAFNVVAPVPPISWRSWPAALWPSTVLCNRISPAPAPVSITTSLVSVIGCCKVILSSLTLISPAVWTAPAPSCRNALSSVMSPLAVKLNNPLLVIVRPPPPVVVIVSFIVNAAPFRSTPAAPFVLIGSLKVVVPVPADCKKLAALIAVSAVRLAALLTIISSSLAVPPIIPSISIFPVPAVISKSNAPLTVPFISIEPPAAPVSSAIFPVRVKALSSTISPPAVVISAAVLNAPFRLVPSRTAPVVVVISPVAASVVVPSESISTSPLVLSSGSPTVTAPV